ncbi:MAG: tRNA lysidine(34) synthetase TilS [Candidatus Saccharibacteria bacterium]
MKIALPPGNYVVAVSGGVDSVVLLDLLRSYPELQLTVAHFDHGMRAESPADRRFVQAMARAYQLPFVYATAHLGPAASEATARTARYAFLETTRRASQAAAIITAHHQDDLLETVVLNLQRGTGRLGLTPLLHRPTIRRPLLSYPKQTLIAHALARGLEWQEDATNADQSYRRNYVRHSLLPQLTAEKRRRLIGMVARQTEINDEIDELLTNYLQLQPGRRVLDRTAFRDLPATVAGEVMASWLRANGLRNFDRKTIERATQAARQGRTGAITELMGGNRLIIGRAELALRLIER